MGGVYLVLFSSLDATHSQLYYVVVICTQAESSFNSLQCLLRQPSSSPSSTRCVDSEQAAYIDTAITRHLSPTTWSPSTTPDNSLSALILLLENFQELKSPTVLHPDVDASVRPASEATSPGFDLYKTELCRAFEERGQCRYGDKCQFAHGSRDVRSVDRHPKYKTELCRTYHSTGFCPYGARCHFVHSEIHSSRSSTSSSQQLALPSLSNAEHQQQMVRQLAANMMMSPRTSTVDSVGGLLPLQSTSSLSPRDLYHQLNLLSSAVDLSVSSVPTTMPIAATVVRGNDRVTLLQHRRRQNVTLTLNSPMHTANAGSSSPNVPFGRHSQPSPSPSSSLTDTSFYYINGGSSSTGSPALSDVFSPIASPISPCPIGHGSIGHGLRLPSQSKLLARHMSSSSPTSVVPDHLIAQNHCGLTSKRLVAPYSCCVNLNNRPPSHFFGVGDSMAL